jgi:hypothetical protein
VPAGIPDNVAVLLSEQMEFQPDGDKLRLNEDGMVDSTTYLKVLVSAQGRVMVTISVSILLILAILLYCIEVPTLEPSIEILAPELTDHV